MILDWNSPEHWSARRDPCIHCGAPTNQRDTAGRPAHRTCVEEAIETIALLSGRCVTCGQLLHRPDHPGGGS